VRALASRPGRTPQARWRLFRPAIWLAMLGVALGIVVNLPLGVLILGCAIGAALRIERVRRRRT
jgi:hypothetical protein